MKDFGLKPKENELVEQKILSSGQLLELHLKAGMYYAVGKIGR